MPRRVFVAALAVVPLLLYSSCQAGPKIVGGGEEGTKRLLKEPAIAALIPSGGVPEDSNLVVGQVQLCGFQGPSQAFRMALMIRSEDGKRITDFFQGIPVSESAQIYTGNAIMSVQKIWHDNVDAASSAISARAKSPKETPPPWARGDAALVSFGADFPDFLDKGFKLTFKEFRGSTYFLQNVPKGRAYVWFQSCLREYRVTQIPFVVQMNVEMGAVNRLDMWIENGGVVFHSLPRLGLE